MKETKLFIHPLATQYQLWEHPTFWIYTFSIFNICLINVYGQFYLPRVKSKPASLYANGLVCLTPDGIGGSPRDTEGMRDVWPSGVVLVCGFRAAGSAKYEHSFKFQIIRSCICVLWISIFQITFHYTCNIHQMYP